MGLERSGAYRLPTSGKLSLRQIIAAGGADNRTTEGAGLSIFCVSMTGGRLRPIVVGEAASLWSAGSSPLLRPGDIVWLRKEKMELPPSEETDRRAEVFVMGNVPCPGVYSSTAGLTLVRALIAAGFDPDRNPESTISLQTRTEKGMLAQVLEGLKPADIFHGQVPDYTLLPGSVIDVSQGDTRSSVSSSNARRVNHPPYASQPATRPAEQKGESNIQHLTSNVQRRTADKAVGQGPASSTAAGKDGGETRVYDVIGLITGIRRVDVLPFEAENGWGKAANALIDRLKAEFKEPSGQDRRRTTIDLWQDHWLVIYTSRENHGRAEALFNRLREAARVQILIEADFLSLSEGDAGPVDDLLAKTASAENIQSDLHRDWPPMPYSRS